MKVGTLSDQSHFLSGFLHELSNAPLPILTAVAASRPCGSSSQVSSLLVEEHDHHCAGVTHGAYETKEGMGIQGRTVRSEGEY
jgi:hypothetical protein